MKKLLLLLTLFILVMLIACKKETVKVSFVYNPETSMIDNYKAYDRDFDSSKKYFYFEAGNLLPIPDNTPSNTLYKVFIGWSQYKDGRVLWDFQHDTINQDLILYGCWEER